MYLSREEIETIIGEAIINRYVLSVTYSHVDKIGDTVTRKQAPFDIGSSNSDYSIRNSNKDKMYMFCYEHIDKKSGIKKPMVHAININHVISISKTGEIFNENELAQVNFENTGFDYRNNFIFAFYPNRGWF